MISVSIVNSEVVDFAGARTTISCYRGPSLRIPSISKVDSAFAAQLQLQLQEEHIFTGTDR